MLRPPRPPSSQPPPDRSNDGIPRLALDTSHHALPSLDSAKRSKNDIFGQNWSATAPNVALLRPSPYSSIFPTTPAPPSITVPVIRTDVPGQDGDGGPRASLSSASGHGRVTRESLGVATATTTAAATSGRPLVEHSATPTYATFHSLPSPSPSATSPPPSLRSAGDANAHARTTSLAVPSTPSPAHAEPNLRLFLSPSYLLGTGRNSEVFLASVRAASAPWAGWEMCAVKRVHADQESQRMGLAEAFALRKLGAARPADGSGSDGGGHPNIVRLLTVKDEVEVRASLRAVSDHLAGASGAGLDRDNLPAVSSREDALCRRSHDHQRSLGFGRPLSTPSASDLADQEQVQSPLPRSVSLIALSRSDAVTKAKATRERTGTARHEGQLCELSRAASTSHRFQAHPRHTQVASVVGVSPASPTPVSISVSIPRDPPRLLLLFELLSSSAHSFVTRRAEEVDRTLFLRWARQLASALAWCHDRGWAHCDVKPENMLLTDALDVKLCDFNSAILIPSPPHPPPTDGLGLGTPAYSAPELSHPPPSPFGFPADLFSIAASWWFLLTAREPFRRVRSAVELRHRKETFWEWHEAERMERMESEMECDRHRGQTVHLGRGRGPPLAASFNDRSNTSMSTRRSARDSSAESVASTGSTAGASAASAAAAATLMGGRKPTLATLTTLVGPEAAQEIVAARGTEGYDSMPASPSPAHVGVRTTTTTTTTMTHARMPSSELSPLLLSPYRPHTPSLLTSSSASVSSADEDGEAPCEQRSRAALADVPEHDHEHEHDLHLPYPDGSPAMSFLGGGRVPDELRELMKRMLALRPSDRPTSKDVLTVLDEL